MKKLLLSFLLFIVIKVSMAQSTGQVTYKLDFSSDNPDMAMALSMMEGSTMDLYFMPQKAKMNMTMGSFMIMNTIVDVKADKSLLLMEIMGQKTATENKLSAPANDSKKEEPKIEYSSETKEIIGFTCKKATIKTEEGDVIMWIAADLKASLDGFEQFTVKGLKGIPLEFSTTNNGMNIHFVATKFEKTVDEKIFDQKIPEGFKLMSAEDLKNMGADF